MRKLVLLLSFLFLSLAAGVLAVAPDFALKWEQASQAYREQRFDEARITYERLVQEGIRNPRLYYNLGNTWFQLGEEGKAAWMYEKALALSPRLEDARKNLRLARAGTPSPESHAFILFQPIERLASRYTAGEWAAALLILSFPVSILAVFWILSRRRILRCLAMWMTLAGALVMIVTGAVFASRYIETEWRDYGVVLRAGAVVRNAPASAAEAYYEASEGERYLITESNMAGWYRVKNPDTGRVGYLPEDAVGLI